MNKLLSAILVMAAAMPAAAQQTLTLDSCRAMALGNNKTLTAAKVQRDMAKQLRKAARTKYLPHLDAVGGYTYTSREISILNNEQKQMLSSIGTIAGGMFGIDNPQITGAMNQIGENLKSALRTDTRNIYTVSAMVTQPVYMGGAIIAANKIADINEMMAANNEEAAMQTTLHGIDKTYWTVVSLRHKQKLADSYLQLVKKLDNDVQKMIDEGVATRADGLKVSVKVNEAEMQVTQVEDGLSLAKMLLCQLCGMPATSQITLADESKESIDTEADVAVADTETAIEQRPEMRLLQNAVELTRQTTKLTRAAYLPQVLLTGGYLMTNPSMFDGFNKKFAGMWNVGVMVRVPVWNWFEGVYKVRATKAATTIARLEMDDTREKLDLQVNQSTFKLNEAYKKLDMAKKNVEKAEENLRCANIGFKEGVLQTTDVMTAQTAWMQAQSQKIDAEVDVKISQTDLKKALGILN